MSAACLLFVRRTVGYQEMRHQYHRKTKQQNNSPSINQSINQRYICRAFDTPRSANSSQL